MNLFVDFHVLQTVPPSCVNRDDTGSPKTAVYGGAVRARVSSQAWKHAMRAEFRTLFTEEELGSRTKYAVDLIVTEMQKLDSSLSEKICQKQAEEALKLAGLKTKSVKKDGEEKVETDALFFISYKQASAIASHLLTYNLNDKEQKKEIEKVLKEDLKENPSVDIALFGRMAASDPTLNYDAAAQVAHAISTHAVQNEYDYFTAVDDLQAEDNAGAGHLGTVEFNSSTLYRYATVNMAELVSTLECEQAIETVKKFGQAFICSMPTGKVNTFANRTFPDVVYVTVRSDQPVNLCGAFEKPVPKSQDGYVKKSEEELVSYAQKVYRQFAAEPQAAFCMGEKLETIAEPLPLPALLSTLADTLRTSLCEG